jgi:hypothetical protein
VGHLCAMDTYLLTLAGSVGHLCSMDTYLLTDRQTYIFTWVKLNTPTPKGRFIKTYLEFLLNEFGARVWNLIILWTFWRFITWLFSWRSDVLSIDYSLDVLTFYHLIILWTFWRFITWLFSGHSDVLSLDYSLDILTFYHLIILWTFWRFITVRSGTCTSWFSMFCT